MKLTFWILFYLILYCYLGYPVILWIFAKLFNKPVGKSELEPKVSVLISAHNEADVIENKIQNILSLNYPSEKLEMLIGSDGSSDRTVELTERFNDSRIRLFDFTNRRGKITVLNDLIREARNEIIVFTDARQIFNQNAIRELVKNFADLDVGCVSGELLFYNVEGATGKGINLYWNYEKFLRRQESRIHSMLGATGAIYAIRKNLYCPAPADTVLDDMFTPFSIIKKGYRAIFDGSAIAYDNIAKDPKEEHRRKVRTLFGNYQIFSQFKEMLVPFNSPVSLQLLSHKFLRILVPFLMISIFVVNIFLLDEYFYKMFAMAQIVFYLMAIIGGLLNTKKYVILRAIASVCYIPYVFCLLNFSAMMGFFRFIGARQEITWEKAREF